MINARQERAGNRKWAPRRGKVLFQSEKFLLLSGTHKEEIQHGWKPNHRIPLKGGRQPDLAPLPLPPPPRRHHLLRVLAAGWGGGAQGPSFSALDLEGNWSWEGRQGLRPLAHLAPREAP